MPTSEDEVKAELKSAYRTVSASLAGDMAEANRITEKDERIARKSKIQRNYHHLKAIYYESKNADLAQTGLAVDRAYAAAVEARTAIANATSKEKTLISRIKRLSTLAGTAADLYVKARKTA